MTFLREICILVIVLQRCFDNGTLNEGTFIDTWLVDAFGRSFVVFIFTFLLIYGKDRLLVL